MLGKILRLTLGVLFIPVGIGYSLAFYEVLTKVRQIRGPELAILLGITAYLAFHAVVKQPTRAYVFGHELMHAAAAWVTGGEVKGFKVGARSGAVRTGKVTGVTALAPYAVPTYTLLWVLLYGLFSLFHDASPWARWFFFGIGFTLAFHLVFTVNVLKSKQSDLDVLGPLLSLMIIYGVNLALVVGVMSLVIPEVRFGAYLADGFRRTLALWDLAARQLFVR